MIQHVPLVHPLLIYDVNSFSRAELVQTDPLHSFFYLYLALFCSILFSVLILLTTTTTLTTTVGTITLTHWFFIWYVSFYVQVFALERTALILNITFSFTNKSFMFVCRPFR